MSKFKSILLLGAVNIVWTGVIEHAYGSMNDERRSKNLRHQISVLNKQGDPENKIPALQEQLENLASQIRETNRMNQALVAQKHIDESNAKIQAYIAEKKRKRQIEEEKGKKETKHKQACKPVR